MAARHTSCRIPSLRIPVPLALVIWLTAPASALAGSYVYEGRLDDRGQPAEGRYDIRLTAFPAAAEGVSLTAPIEFSAVEVSGGRFRLEFEAALAESPEVWLDLAIRDGGDSGAYAPIPGRTKAIAAPLIGACWSSTGDSGSNPATNFLGTTDAQPFVVRTANAPSLRIEPSTITFGTPAVPITSNTIGGSHANAVTSGVRGATIAGGGVPSGSSDPDFPNETPNRVTDHYATVGGGFGNRAGNDDATLTNASFATVSGGRSNTASGSFSTVSGGESNFASFDYGTVGGGYNNRAGGTSTVGGGEINNANGGISTIGGGKENSADGFLGTVGGGYANYASADFSSVGGGDSNTSRGDGSTVSGGKLNCAGGALSWAGGHRAKVRLGSGSVNPGLGCDGAGQSGDADGDNGTFAWADSQNANFVSTGADQFLIRASGGAVFQRQIPGQTNARRPRALFNVVRGDSGIGQPSTPSDTVLANFESDGDGFLAVLGPAASNRGLLFGGPDNTADGGLVFVGANDSLQLLTAGSTRMTVHGNGEVQLAVLGTAGGTALCRNASNRIAACSSSARYKDSIKDLPFGLDQVLALRPVSYRWKDSGAADVGFVAEEVAALDERLVTRNDKGEVEGVKYERLTAVLANAVQELAARDSLREEEMARLQARLEALEARLSLGEER